MNSILVCGGILVSLIAGQWGFGQQTAEQKASSAVELEETDGDGIAVSVTPGGVQRFSHGGWAALSVVGANRTDADSEEVVSVFVDDNPNLQFTKKFWVPAHSKRQTWMPLQIPQETSEEGDRVDLSIIRIEQSASGESFGTTAIDMPVVKRSLMLIDNEINTGLIAEPLDIDLNAEIDQRRSRLNDILDVSRDTASSTPSDFPIVNFLSNFIPPTAGALDEMDQVVIAGDHLLDDMAGTVAMRRWLRDGGRVWIMLDRVSPVMVTRLLGDQADFVEIDRVEINDFQMATLDPVSGRPGPAESWTSETPATLVRVLTDIKDITCRIDGWPAAFWIPVGSGEVLVTTLSMEGWMGERSRAGAGLYQLSRRFFEPRVEPSRLISEMQPIVDDQIGYAIPTRRLAGWVLGINALVITIAGCWWAHQRRLEKLAILVPVSAMATTAVMLSIGSHHAQSVPSTVATSQVVHIRSASNEADVSSLHAVYSQQSGSIGLESTGHVLAMPLESVDTDETQRVSADDGGTSRWIGPGQPPGVVRHLVSHSTIALSESISLRGTFNADGFQGTLTGLDITKCQDGLIVAAPAPFTSATWDGARAENQIAAKTTDLLPPGQFVPGALLSDRQRLRQEFLQRAFLEPQGGALASGPSLLLWTDSLDNGVRFSDRFTRTGSAIVSIPIQLERPQAGADFRIPATFVRTNTFQTDRGRSTMFNPRTGRWMEQLTKPSEVELLFEFPESIQPMTLRSVSVAIKASAPSRTLFVKAMAAGQPVTVFEQDNVTGVVRFSIPRTDVLEQQPGGGLWLAVGVGESIGAAESRRSVSEPEIVDKTDAAPTEHATAEQATADLTTWQIDYVHVDAVASIDPDTLSSPVVAIETGQP